MSDLRNYPLLETIDRLEQNKHHSMLLYDDAKYGTTIKNRFVENGLKKGEHVISFTPDDLSLLEKEIESSDIDIDFYKRKNLLHFFHIEDITKRQDGILAGYYSILKKITTDSKEPCRFIGKIIPDISTKTGILAELQTESTYHTGFENNPCSFLCPYDISDIEKEQRSYWIKKLLSYHHHMIYATKPEKAVTFDTDLLNTEEI